jgi:hypothetical protein
MRRARQPGATMRMCAMTVVPGQKGTAGLEAFPDPGMQDGALLVRGMRSVSALSVAPPPAG